MPGKKVWWWICSNLVINWRLSNSKSLNKIGFKKHFGNNLAVKNNKYIKNLNNKSNKIEDKKINNFNGIKMDIWALGCHYYKLITTNFLISPIDSNNLDNLFNSIKICIRYILLLFCYI